MPHRQLSRHLAGASALSLVLIIAGCSSGQSTTGSALSKEATACYSEYVDLHGDIKKAYKAQISTGIASQSEYGKAHYEGIGASKGRALPQGCAEHLQISTSCYASYVDQNADLLTAFNATGQQDKSAWGKWHYENRPAADTRALPEGCTYEYTPPPVDTSAAYTDAQMLAYLNCYDDLKRPGWSDAAKIAYARKHYRLFGQAEGRTCGLVEEASSDGGGGLSRCAGITSSTSKAAGVFTSKANLSTAIATWIANSTTATATYGDINTWDVTAIPDMSRLFQGKLSFNDDIGCWDVTGVTTMEAMFDNARAFNQNIEEWNTQNVTNMSGMFVNAYVFNQSIGNWNTSAVTDMSYMFFVAKAFNKSLNNWNTSRVTTMFNMFAFTEAFNRDIGSWDVSSVQSMRLMFNNATAFNQDLSNWSAGAVTNCANFATGATAWLAAYGGAIANKNPPLSATLIAASCQ